MAQSGRRPGQNETREAILDAARAEFAAKGFDGATVRGIAAAAGVNPALLHHFFGSKDKVFFAAVRLPVDPATLLPRVLDGPREEIGQRLVRALFAVFGQADTRDQVVGVLRSVASNEAAARMVRQFVEHAMLGPLAEALDMPKARLGLAAGQAIGLVLTRYVLAVGPLVDADDEELVAIIAPVMQYYLVGGDVPRTA